MGKSSQKERTREQSIKEYEKYIRNKLKSNEIKISELEKLRGKNLGCWFKNDVLCHGDILIKLLKKRDLQ